jgi:hypothetical protein
MNSTTLKHSATALATIALGMGLAATANAKPSTQAEIRGYQTCVNAAERKTKDMDTTHHYLLKRETDAKRYYINAYQWQNGERVAVRVACTTSLSGLSLADVSVDQGRYKKRDTRVTIEVAGK